MQSRQTGEPGRSGARSSSVSGDLCALDRNDGSQSDTAAGAPGAGGRKRRSSLGAKVVAIVGLSRRSRSASQLGRTGRRPSFRCSHRAGLRAAHAFLSRLLLQWCGRRRVPRPRAPRERNLELLSRIREPAPKRTSSRRRSAGLAAQGSVRCGAVLCGARPRHALGHARFSLAPSSGVTEPARRGSSRVGAGGAPCPLRAARLLCTP